MATPSNDPIVLGAQLRAVLEGLHERSDVVVRLYSDESGYAEDSATENMKGGLRGRYDGKKKNLALNLDELSLGHSKNAVRDLSTPKHVQKFPLLAGIAAHESAHVKFSRWGNEAVGGLPIPKHIPNPGDPEKPFSVSETGKMVQWAEVLEEARVDRLAVDEFPTTWGRSLNRASFHDIKQMYQELKKQAQEAEKENANNPEGAPTPAPKGLDSVEGVAKLTALVHGKAVAGSIDAGSEPVRAILDLCEKALDGALGEGTYQALTDVIGDHTFNDDHTNPWPHLEAARRFLAVLEPENQENPDGGGGGKGESGEDDKKQKPQPKPQPKPKPEEKPEPSEGEGEDEKPEEGEGSGEPGEGEQEGEGEGSGEPGEDESEGQGGSAEGSDGEETPEENAGESREEPEENPGEAHIDDEIAEALEEALEDWTSVEESLTHAEGENPADPDEVDSTKKMSGHGTTVFNNPRAPKVLREDSPSDEDREMYHAAQRWLERQVMPTITEIEQGQWLPGGGARLDVRAWVRDNLADHRASQRSDWSALVEDVQQAPPIRVGIMLDASGSMSSLARLSAGAAWAIANAAADLPEARTVSVAFGDQAGVTQAPGHGAPPKVNVMNTNGGTENFSAAADLVEAALWLGDEDLAHEDPDRPVAALIIVVSDLAFYGDSLGHKNRKSQAQSFVDKVNEWTDKGFRVISIGATSKVGGDTSRVRGFFTGTGATKDAVNKAFDSIEFVSEPSAKGLDLAFGQTGTTDAPRQS